MITLLNRIEKIDYHQACLDSDAKVLLGEVEELPATWYNEGIPLRRRAATRRRASGESRQQMGRRLMLRSPAVQLRDWGSGGRWSKSNSKRAGKENKNALPIEDGKRDCISELCQEASKKAIESGRHFRRWTPPPPHQVFCPCGSLNSNGTPSLSPPPSSATPSLSPATSPARQPILWLPSDERIR